MTRVRNSVIIASRCSLDNWHALRHPQAGSFYSGLDERCSVLADRTDMLRSLHKHYYYSAKALRELQELANMMAQNCNCPVNVSGSTWVLHNCRALKVVYNKYKLIHAHMQETAMATNCSAIMKGKARWIDQRNKRRSFNQQQHSRCLTAWSPFLPARAYGKE